MKYLFVEKCKNGSIRISAEHKPATRFYFYSKRDAIAKYRRDNGLRYKHLTIIENSPITGVKYGLVELNDEVITDIKLNYNKTIKNLKHKHTHNFKRTK
jgi:hypothetical protein